MLCLLETWSPQPCTFPEESPLCLALCHSLAISMFLKDTGKPFREAISRGDGVMQEFRAKPPASGWF